jgi:hypothetical protein
MSLPWQIFYGMDTQSVGVCLYSLIHGFASRPPGTTKNSKYPDATDGTPNTPGTGTSAVSLFSQVAQAETSAPL